MPRYYAAAAMRNVRYYMIFDADDMDYRLLLMLLPYFMLPPCFDAIAPPSLRRYAAISMPC